MNFIGFLQDINKLFGIVCQNSKINGKEENNNQKEISNKKKLLLE